MSNTCMLFLMCHQLYANLKKCTFCMEYVVFLRYVFSSQGISFDEEKVKVVRDWPTSKNVNAVRSFHGLASFYRRFVKNFSFIATPLNELVKKNVVFKWDDVHDRAFKTLKDKLTNAPLLCLSNFDKAFKVECDASGIGIGADKCLKVWDYQEKYYILHLRILLISPKLSIFLYTEFQNKNWT